MDNHAIVVDIGKTLSKVTLWTPDGVLVARRDRPNERIDGPGYVALDVAGIESWLFESLSEMARLAPVNTIVPVAHGAGLALIRNGALQLPPMDYENPVPAAERARYERQRDSFLLTGSPALPNGLNIGAQLHWLEALHPQVLQPGTLLVTWAQYWAWRLCGVAATEVSSLGCHTDLWQPLRATPSALAERRGWARLLAPLHRAADCLGNVTAECIARTGLSSSTRVHCGLHDSNAALLAARGFPQLSNADATILSTGTWFVAMRTPQMPVALDSMAEGRDCLMNVDVDGNPVPSARFMGGREIATLTGTDARGIDIATDQPRLIAALPRALDEGACVLPTFAAGSGPFSHARGRWNHMPADEAARRAAVGLYAALVADASLDLIGATGHVVVEGRFAQAEVLVRALASLRPDMKVHVAHADNDVACGALRLLDATLAPKQDLKQVDPLPMSLHALRQDWREEAERMEMAA